MLEAVWDYSIIFQTLACNSPRRTTSASEEHHVLCWHQGCSLRDGSARTLGAQSGVGSFLFLGSFQVGAQPLLNHLQELVALVQLRHFACGSPCTCFLHSVCSHLASTLEEKPHHQHHSLVYACSSRHSKSCACHAESSDASRLLADSGPYTTNLPAEHHVQPHLCAGGHPPGRRHA